MSEPGQFTGVIVTSGLVSGWASARDFATVVAVPESELEAFFGSAVDERNRHVPDRLPTDFGFSIPTSTFESVPGVVAADVEDGFRFLLDGLDNDQDYWVCVGPRTWTPDWRVFELCEAIGEPPQRFVACTGNCNWLRAYEEVSQR